MKVEAAQIIITLFPNGNLNLQCPIQNKLLCYGMLEMARDIIKDFKPEDQPKIQVVPGLPGLKGGRNGSDA